MSQPRFAGSSRLLTGAASGIGRATALRLASEGARIFACDVDKTKLDETVAAITAAGGVAAAHPLDVSDPVACREAVAAAAQRFGKLDVLCNIAGVMCWGHVPEISEAEWNRVVAVNLSGVFFLCQAADPAPARVARGDRQHGVGRRDQGTGVHAPVLGDQGGGDLAHEVSRPRVRQARAARGGGGAGGSQDAAHGADEVPGQAPT